MGAPPFRNERSISNLEILKHRHSTFNECVRLFDHFDCILFGILGQSVYETGSSPLGDGWLPASATTCASARFEDFPRMVGFLSGPVPEARPESVPSYRDVV